MGPSARVGEAGPAAAAADAERSLQGLASQSVRSGGANSCHSVLMVCADAEDVQGWPSHTAGNSARTTGLRPQEMRTRPRPGAKKPPPARNTKPRPPPPRRRPPPPRRKPRPPPPRPKPRPPPPRPKPPSPPRPPRPPPPPQPYDPSPFSVLGQGYKVRRWWGACHLQQCSSGLPLSIPHAGASRSTQPSSQHMFTAAAPTQQPTHANAHCPAGLSRL